MPKTDRFRALYVLKYLWEHTDEEHPVTLAQFQTHLSVQGIEAIPKTIDGDITALQDLGFDIIRNRSTQNQYFFASRYFSSFELKLIYSNIGNWRVWNNPEFCNYDLIDYLSPDGKWISSNFHSLNKVYEFLNFGDIKLSFETYAFDFNKSIDIYDSYFHIESRDDALYQKIRTQLEQDAP
jgi:hypothetical protein